MLGALGLKKLYSTRLPEQKPLHPKEGSKLPLMKPERGMILHTERKLEGYPDAVLGPRKKAGRENREKGSRL